jgi:lactate racemase
MNISLKYGNALKTCHIDDRIRTEFLIPPNGAPVPSLPQALKVSLKNPVDSPPLRDLISPNDRITIVVPDKTRQAILDRILPHLLDYLAQLGVGQKAVTVLFANGTHQKQSDAEMEQLVGPQIWKNIRVIQHDARDDNSLEHVTTTTRGTRITLNRNVIDTDRVITVGSILHHYFAGFGGGPKLLVPGVAGYETAQRNHSYTIDGTGSFHTACRDGNIGTNPVYQDIAEAVRAIPNVFSINIVLDASDRPTAVISGDCVASHRRASQKASELYEVPIGEQADVVLVSPGGTPRDTTFIQSHKAIHHAFYAVKPGGTIITVAACNDGIGSSTFLQWFEVPFKSLGEKLLSSYSLNGHTALSLRTKLNRNGISLVSDLEETTVSYMGIVPLLSLQSAVERILDDLSGSPLVFVLPYGALTVPVVDA